MRHARRVVLALTGLLLVPVVLVGILIAALRTPWVEGEARQRLAALLADATGARVSIGSLRATLLAGIRLRDVALVFPAGARVAAAHLTGSVSLAALLGGRIEIGTVRASGVRVRVRPAAPGWGFDDTADDQDGAPTPLPTLRARRVVVDDGRLDVAFEDGGGARHLALDDLALDAGFAMDDADGVRVNVARLSGMPRGIAVSRLTARGRVAVGATGDELTLEDVAVATRRSQLAGAARVAFDRRLDARLEVAPLSSRELRALVPAVAVRPDLTGTVSARGPWRRIGIRAGLATPSSGAVRLFGVLDAGADDLRYRATARVRRLDLAAIDPTLPESVLSGRVHGRGALTTLATPLGVRLRLTPSTIAGARLDGARLAGRIVADGLDARGSVHAPGGRATIDGRLTWAGEPAYTARTRVRVDDLTAFVPGLAGTSRLRATVEGRGFSAPGRSATLHAQLDGGRIGGVPLDGGAADLTLRGDVLALAHGSVLASGLRADASGTLDLRQERLEVAVAVAGDVTRAMRRAGVDDAGGVVSGRATLRGGLRALAVDGSATAERLRRGALTLERAALAATLGGVGGDAPAGRATVDATNLRAGEASPWSGTVAGEWQRSAGADTATVSARAADDDGARVATRGTLRRSAAGAVTAEVAELVLAPSGQPAWALTAPARLATDGTSIAVDRLELVAGAQRAILSGRAGRTGPADVRIEWHDVDLTQPCRLRTLACAGRASGSGRLTGTAAAPALALTLRADRLTVEQSPAATLELTADYADRALAFRGSLAQTDTGTLDLAGTLPVDLAWDGPRRDLAGAPIDVRVRTDGLDLGIVRLLAPESIRQSGGRLAADVRLGGSWNDLHATGPLSLRDGRLGLAATGVTYEGIEISALARGETIELQSVRARAGTGTLEGAGTMALVATTTTPFALRLRFADFLAVSLPAYEAATDGTLSVEGSIAYPVVRGELVLTRLLVRPSVLADSSGPSLKPDPTIEVVGLPPLPSEAEAAASLDVADALSLDVGLRIVRDAWIRRADADVELRGALQLGKEAYRPLFVTGELRLQRGWYAFQGRRFEVGDGRIVFGGDVPPDPMLDITAINRTGEYEVTVQITGRATEPALALSSSPPLEQADILSLLVFGRPARDLGRGESVDLQRQALSLASGYMMPELRQSMMKTLDLDTFELGDEGVRAGRYVSRDVFVTLAQDFTGRAGQTMGVEYSVTRRLSLKLSTSTQGTSAIDLLWRRRY